MQFIDLRSQYQLSRDKINKRIQTVLDHGQYIMGPEVSELESALVAYTGASECITVSSGTEALLISLMALGIGPGDEVITSPFTFAATAEVIALVGAVPVFVDAEPDTCNIDPTLIEAAVTSRTRVIMPVSLYGQIADMDQINAIAEKHGLVVIEDAAQSFGASYRDKKSCAVSRIGCTSFFPSKPLGCYGDGGAIFTNDSALAKIMREIRVHGQEKRYFHTRIGVGGRMDTLQCAIVLAKLETFDWELTARSVAGERYINALAGHNKIRLPAVRPDRNCVWAQFTIKVDERDRVAAYMQSKGIPTAIHYPLPLHLQPAYEKLCRISGKLTNSEELGRQVLSLPMHPFIEAEAQSAVVDAVFEAVV